MWQNTLLNESNILIKMKSDNNKILNQRISREIREEYVQQIKSLKDRNDYIESYAYFLNVLSLTYNMESGVTESKKPIAGLYCIQAPLELFDSFGFRPVRLGNGSFPIQRLSTGLLPVLSCPIIKSRTGAFFLDNSLENLCDFIIVPTTCDWSSKLPQLTRERFGKFHIMELPRVKESERARDRWFEEMFELKLFLERQSRSKFSVSRLAESINRYMKAWALFGDLIKIRREGKISGIWFNVISNAFMMDSSDSWSLNVRKVIESIPDQKMNNNSSSIFLAGAPVLFPYLKITEIIEDAGMGILADELCSSERIMESVVYDEATEYSMLKALADRSFLACKCPVYSDNDRRLGNMINTMRINDIKGVIYHSLKGCHPYEADSFYFEKRLKKEGFRFLKIETDFSKEDKQNILTRLEAFRETLH